MTRWRRLELAGMVALLLLATWLRWRVVLEVPPGLEMDPLIEAQIAEQVLNGDWRPFYEAGQGREGLYHYWLAIWLATLDKHVLTLRMASTFLNLLGLTAGYGLIRRLFGPAVALVGLAGGAISFWTVFAARSGLRSTVLPPVAALAGYFFWRGISGSTSHRSAAPNLPLATRSSQSAIRSLQFLIYSGLCLGLSFYAYTAARVLPAVFGLFVLYLLAFHRHWLQDQWKGLALGAGIAVLVALPLLVYLHAHPEADEFEFLDFNRPLTALEAGDPEPALQTSLATLGMFTFQGDPLIFDNVPGRPVFEPLGGMLFLAGVAIAVRRFRQPAYVFTLIWLLVGLVPGMLSQPAPNFYRTVGAQVVAFAFPGVAVVEAWRWFRRRWPQRTVRPALVGGLALLLGLNLTWNFRDYFVVWPRVERVPFFWQTALTEMARYLDRSPDTSPVALCTSLTYEHDPWWRPAWQSMRYLLHRSDLSLRYYDCADTMVFIDGPARYAFPDATGVDALNQFPAYRHFLAAANIGLEFLPDGPGIIVHNERTPTLYQHVAEVAADATVAWAPEAGAADQPARVPINFEDRVEFLGYDLSASSLKPGASFDLVTYWRVTGGLPPQLSQFTHLLNADGAIITQQDRLALTSASLRAGDVFAQAHHLTPPGNLAEGEYPLTIGLYTPDGIRLRVTQASQPRGDRLWLRPIVVEK